jgi:hypothetical protein
MGNKESMPLTSGYTPDPTKTEDENYDIQTTLAAIARNHASFQYFTPEQRRDKSIVLKAVMQNGFALMYADEFKNDPDVILAAMRQNALAFHYVPEELALKMINEDSSKLRYASDAVILIALGKNGNLCGWIDPTKLLTLLLRHSIIIKELNLSEDCIIGLIKMQPDFYQYVSDAAKMHKPIVMTALTRDPKNYLYVPKTYPHHDELRGLMPVSILPPAPPTFARTISTTTSTQSGPTCSYHANAKVFLHNRFEFILPLDKSIYNKECDKFLDVCGELNLTDLTPDMCTEGGYRHVLLFVYLYFIGIDTGKTNYYDTLDAKTRSMTMPIFFDKPENAQHKAYLNAMLTHINTKTNETRIKWMDCRVFINEDEDEDMLYQVISKLTTLNFYVSLGLGTHRVIITDTQDDSYRIKNSWGEDYDIVKSLKLLFLQRHHLPYRTRNINCYLPINENMLDLPNFSTLIELNTWIDQSTPEITRLRKILVGGKTRFKTKRYRKSYRFKNRKTKRNKLKKI